MILQLLLQLFLLGDPFFGVEANSSADYLDRNHTDGRTSAGWDRGSFKHPSSYVRPKFRYWAPDALMEDSIIDHDLQQFKKIGMGGFELISYQLYGDPSPFIFGIPVVDWAYYGFGSENWKERFNFFTETANKYALNMDFALGPNQGNGVPVEVPSAPGVSTGLERGNMTLKTGETYSGKAPPPDVQYGPPVIFQGATNQNSPATLIGACAGRVARLEANGSVIFLDESSMIDLADQIVNDTITFTAPGNDTGDWYVFSFWQRRTGQLASIGGFNGRQPNLPASGGSYIVDHFSEQGAKVSTDFHDQYFIDEDTSQAFEQSTMYAWEDSIEITVALYWTDTFPEDFESRRGYSLFKYLPLFYTAYPEHQILFDSQDNGTSYVVDYRQTLTEKYFEYMNAFKEWAHEKGIQYSNQPAYNLPLDVSASSAFADAPEGESLGFVDLVDTFRQFSGGAHLSGARIFSSECGAGFGAAYSYTWPDLIHDIRTNWAGGVNQLVLHGSPYSGNYPNTTWPGYTTFSYQFAAMHNDRQPSWEYYKPIMEYISRNQYALQAGVPKIDLAFYRYAFEFPAPGYEGRALWDAGYTWDYVSPTSFDLPGAVVRDGRLANDGPAYKVIIIDNSPTLTVGAASYLTQYAADGLPIIFIGTIPSATPGKNVTGSTFVNSTVQALLGNSNVKHIDTEADLLSALKTLDIAPDAASSFIPVHRFDSADDEHFFFLYNFNDTSTQSVTLQATGVPFLLDAWTGHITRIAEYTATASTITINVTLVANTTALIAVGSADAFPNTHGATDAPHVTSKSFIGNVSYSKDNKKLRVKSFASGVQTLTLSSSSNKTKTLSLTLPSVNPTPILLHSSPWHLSISSWTPGPNISDATTTLKTTVYDDEISHLMPWPEIDPALTNVSGIATYTTTFNLSSSSPSSQISHILTLPPIFNTVALTLNSHPLSTPEFLDPWVPLPSHLLRFSSGGGARPNKLTITIATTLQNVLVGLPFNVSTSAVEGDFGVMPRQEYALLGEVKVLEVGEVVVGLG